MLKRIRLEPSNEETDVVPLKLKIKTELEELQEKYGITLDTSYERLLKKAVVDVSKKPELSKKIRELFFELLKKENSAKAHALLRQICRKKAGNNKLTKEQMDMLVDQAFSLPFSAAVISIIKGIEKIF